MPIQYFADERVFKLDTDHASYLIALLGAEGLVAHVYYGPKLAGHALNYLLGYGEPPAIPGPEARDRAIFEGDYPKEYPTHGLGDDREPALAIRTAEGHTTLKLCYQSHAIYPGKPALAGLPATFGDAADCTTLAITCADPLVGLEVVLLYTTFADVDVIARSVQVKNTGAAPLWLERVLSASIDIENRDYDIVTIHGDWAREGQTDRYPFTRGSHRVEARGGKSGPMAQPFLALAEHGADQERGEVFAMSLVYSGNFLAQAGREAAGPARCLIGIHPDDFCWKLEPGGVFQAPEAVLVHSTEGLGGMTQNFHALYRRHLIRGEYQDAKRPVLINNWEATYFDFDIQKLLAITQSAAGLGIEMLVVDDGWFGKRKDDTTSLGDWFADTDKLPEGLPYLVSEVNKLGMKFGIWMEPEMVSPDSELYRAHPDWAIAVPGRLPTRRRNQYVLDLARPEVVEGIYARIAAVLHSANIEYLKWDMNRSLTDMASLGLPADRQGEQAHRYVLGLYELQGRLTREFPHLLLENCSSGGGRFDAGMLYYSPQIWTSDDTDAVERLGIQEGAAMLYPLSALGAHVSDCPNHVTGRSTPFATRGAVALAGTFGYELDVTRIPAQDCAMIPAQVALYHKYNELVRNGTYYRLASYAANHTHDCWMVVSPDRAEALVSFVHVLLHPGEQVRVIRLRGLDPAAVYSIEGESRACTGEELLYAGYRFYTEWASGDFSAKLLHLTREEL